MVFLLFGIALGLGLLYGVRSVLLLLVLAVFFAYLVSPPVRLLREAALARGRGFTLPLALAIGLVYLAIFGSLAIAIVLLLPVLDREFAELTREAPGYLARARDQWHLWQDGYRVRGLPAGVREAFDHGAHQVVAAAETYVTGELLPRVGSGLTYLPGLLLVPILAFFLLKDARVLRHFALRVLPRGKSRSRGIEFLGELDHTLAAYIRAQVTACMLVGAVCAIGFLVMGVPYAVALGIAAGLLEFIPLAGPMLIGLIAVGFAAFHSAALAAGVLGFLAVLRVVQDYVVYPKLVGPGTHMHPLSVILAILCGAEVGGVMGVFLAVPLVAVLTVAYRHFREHRAAPALDAAA